MSDNTEAKQDVKIAVLEERFEWIQNAMNQHHAITNDKLDKTLEKLIQMNGSIGKAHIRIDEIHPHVEDYKQTKRKAIMGLVCLGGLSGVFGSKISQIFQQFFGGL